MTRSATLLATTACLFAGAAMAQSVDPELPEYEPASGVSGSINSIGSDTLNNLMTLWAEGFRGEYPNVSVEIQGAGSGTAPPALVEGTANFGPMSRPMRGTEIEEFEDNYGYEPTPIRGAIDALGVFVHQDNPLDCVTMQQVDAMFSSTRSGGADAAIRTWGDAGLEGDWAGRELAMYGRNSASGTYGYFRDVALFGGDYSADVREQPGSSTVIQGVASDVNGVGYSGIGYATADVKALEIEGDDGECYAPTAENAVTGNYPIARFLYIYVNKDPNEDLDPLRAEFVRYVYSRQGQEDVVRAGFFPVVNALAEQELDIFGLGD